MSTDDDNDLLVPSQPRNQMIFVGEQGRFATQEEWLNDVITSINTLYGRPDVMLNQVMSVVEAVEILVKVKDIFIKKSYLLEVDVPVKVLGDIHGQFQDMQNLFDIIGRVPSERMLFLGDYVDRGQQGLECICYIRNKCKYTAVMQIAMRELNGSIVPNFPLHDTASRWSTSDRVEYSPSLRYGLHISQEGAISDVSYTVNEGDGIKYTAMLLRVTLMDIVDRKYRTSVKQIDLPLDAYPHQLALLTYYWLDDNMIMLLYVDGKHLVRLLMELCQKNLLLQVVDTITHPLLFEYDDVRKMCSAPIVTIDHKKYVVPFAFHSATLVIPLEITDEHPVTIMFNKGFLFSANWALGREGNVYFPVDPVFEPYVFLNPIRKPATVVYRLNLTKLNMEERFCGDVSEVPELLSIVRFYGEKAESIMEYMSCGTSLAGYYMLKYKKPSVAYRVPTRIEVFNSVPRNVHKAIVSLSSSCIPTIYGNSLLIWTTGLSETAEDDAFKDQAHPQPMNFIVLADWVAEVCQVRSDNNGTLDFPSIMFSQASPKEEREMACLHFLADRMANLAI